MARTLLKGMINACRLRTESDSKTDEPIYKRNPYTNVDILVGRLMGKETVSYGTTYTFRGHGSDWSVKLDEKGLNLTNNKNGSEIFQINIRKQSAKILFAISFRATNSLRLSR